MSTHDTLDSYITELPVDDWAWSLMFHIDHYIRDLELHIPSLPKKICSTLVIEAIKSFIESQSSYKSNLDTDDGLIQYIVSQPWFMDKLDGIYELTGVIVSYLHQLVLDTLTDYFAKNTNDVLELISTDGHRYFIKNNGDYRIHEYYRLKNLYEPDDQVDQFLQTPSDLDEKNRKLTKLDAYIYNYLEQEMEFKIACEQYKRTQIYFKLISDPANSNIVPTILSTIKKAYG